MDDHALEVFFDVQSELPRQGPGDEASTRRALAMCDGLPASPEVLDVGCGPGAQTLVLAAALPGATITAVDLHRPYLDDLEARAVRAGVAGRIVAQTADMAALPFAPHSFDLIWAEGSAYSMGVEAALGAWRPLLRRGGHLALTELVWLTDTPSPEAADFFEQEYPAMTGQDEIASAVRASGYRLLGRFTLPDSAWWDDYYTPLAARLATLDSKYEGDETARSVIAAARQEQRIRRDFGADYGYVFFVARKTD